MKNQINRPLMNVTAQVCLLPKWLKSKLDSVGEPMSVLADSKLSANILSDEEIIYYLNGMDSILQVPTLYDLFNEGLGVWYVTKGRFDLDTAIFRLLSDTARMARNEITARYRDENPDKFEHIVMGHYLRGPDSDVDLTANWHIDFDTYNVGRNIYMTWEIKSGPRLPHTESNFCKQLLMALDPFVDRKSLRQSKLYAKVVTAL